VRNRNRSGLSLSLPGRCGCPRFTGIGPHLCECFLHRLFGSAGLQIFRNRSQRTSNIFDLFSCHAGWTPAQPRLGKVRPRTARVRAEPSAAPRRKGCYQPEKSQLQNRSVATPFLQAKGCFLQTKGCGSGATVRRCAGIQPVWNCTPGLEKTELKKFLAGPNHATRRRLPLGLPNNYFKVDRADFAL
jgi:hypothetical protein